VYDGYEGQVNETARAINGHLATALMLESTYGEGILGGRMSEEAAAYRNKEWTKLDELVSGYSSAEDYWKLKKNGKIEYDGKNDLYDEDGNRLMFGVKTKNGKEQLYTSLVKFMGISAIEKTLKSKGYTDAELKAMSDEDKGRAVYEISKQGYTSDAAIEMSIFDKLVAGMDKPRLTIRSELRGLADGVNAIAKTLKPDLAKQFGAQGSENSFENLFAYYMEYGDVVSAGNPGAWLNDNIVKTTINGKTMYMNKYFVDTKIGGESIAQLVGKAMLEEGINWQSGDGVFVPRRINDFRYNDLSPHALGVGWDIANQSNGQLIFESNPGVVAVIKAVSGVDITKKQGTETLIAASRALQELNNPFSTFRQDYTSRYDLASSVMAGLKSGAEFSNELLEKLENQGFASKTSVAGSDTFTYTIDKEKIAAYLADNAKAYQYLKINNDGSKNQKYKDTIQKWVNNGFVSYSHGFITTMKEYGFDWGGSWAPWGKLDSMHWDTMSMYKKWQWR